MSEHPGCWESLRLVARRVATGCATALVCRQSCLQPLSILLGRVEVIRCLVRSTTRIQIPIEAFAVDSPSFSLNVSFVRALPSLSVSVNPGRLRCLIITQGRRVTQC